MERRKDVVICYAEEDSELAVRIANGLEAAGFSTWYYERDSVPGPPHIDQTTDAIESAEVVVLVISPRSIVAPQVESEVICAHEANKHFIPLLYELSHAEFEQQKPNWRRYLRAAASVRITPESVPAVLPRIVKGLERLREHTSRPPPPSPERGLDSGQTRPEPKRPARATDEHKGPASDEPGERAKQKVIEDERRRSRRRRVARWVLSSIAGAVLVGVVAYLLFGGRQERPARPQALSLLPRHDRLVPRATLTGHTNRVTSVVFSPDGKTLASGGWDGTVRCWDAWAAKLLNCLGGDSGLIYCAAFSPDGKLVANVGDDGQIRLWNAGDGRLERVWVTGHADAVYFVTFSPDGASVATCSRDSTIKLWDVQTGREKRILAGHKGSVLAVAFSPDGKLLASGSSDGTVRLWNVQTGSQARELTGHTNWVAAVAFSPNGKVLASGSGDRAVRLWDVATGARLLTLSGHTDGVRAVAFADHKTLVSAGRDGTIRVWNVGTGSEKQSLNAQQGVLWTVACSSDGRLVASGGEDKTVKIWTWEVQDPSAPLPGSAGD